MRWLNSVIGLLSVAATSCVSSQASDTAGQTAESLLAGGLLELPEQSPSLNTELGAVSLGPPPSANLEAGAVVVRDGFLGVQEQYLGHAAIFWFYDARANEYRVLQASGATYPVGPRRWVGFLDGNNQYVGSLGLHPRNVVGRDELVYSALYHVGAPYTLSALQSGCGLDVDVCDLGNEEFQTLRNCISFPLYIPCDGLRCDGLVDLVYRNNGLLLYTDFLFPFTPLKLLQYADSVFHFTAQSPKAFGQLVDPANGTVRFMFDEWMSKYSLSANGMYGPQSITAQGDISGSLDVEIVEYEHPQRIGGEIMDFLYWYDPNIPEDWYANFDYSQYFNGPQWPCVYYPNGTGLLPSGAAKDDNRHDVSAVVVRVLGGVPGERVTVSINSNARDLGGNQLLNNADGATVEFAVPGGGPDVDITAPTVQILDPLDGERLNNVGTTTIRVSAFDDETVERVDFFADGLFIGDDSTPSNDTPPVYTRAWFLNDFYGQVLLEAVAYDVAGNAASDSIVVTVDRDATPCGLATFGEWDLEEIGDGDGVIERGESAELRVPITAAGGFMNDVIAVLRPSVAGFIEEPDNIDDLGGFLQGQSKSAGTYVLTIPSHLPQNVEFRLELTYNDGSASCLDQDTRVFSFPPQGALSPAFAVCQTSIVEDDPSDAGQNDGNGQLENGEDAELLFSLQNTGSADALNVRARPLGFDSPGLEVNTNYENFGDILQGECLSTLTDTWDLDAARDLAPGTYVSDIEVTYDGAPQPVILSGALQVEVEPEAWLVVSPQSRDFGVVSPADTVSEPFALVNGGTEPLTITSIVPSTPDTSLSRATPFTIAAGASETVYIQVDTSSLNGAIAREMLFQTDARVRDPGEDDTARVSGSVSSSFPVYSVGDVTGADDPEVGSNLIAWVDSRNGNNDIWAFDLQAGQDFPLVIADGDQYSPRIDGEWLCWSDSRGGTGTGSERTFDVRAKHLPTGAEIIVAGTAQDERIIGVSGDYIAFRRGYADLLKDDGTFSRRSYNLYVYRISDGTTMAITSYTHNGIADAPTVPSNSEFQDGFLVWEQYSHQYANGNWQSISSSSLRRVVIYPGCSAVDLTPDTLVSNYDGGTPSTSECRIVWEQEGPNGCGDQLDQITLWHSGIVSQLTPNFSCEDADFRDPVLSGDLITYEKRNRDLPGNPRYLAMRSIMTNQETIITTSTPLDPWRMDGLVVTWRDGPTSRVLFSYLGVSDFGISADGIQVLGPLTDGTPVDASVTVTNNTPIDTGTGAVIRLYNGDPDSFGVEVAAATIPALNASSTGNIQLGPFSLDESPQSLVAVIESTIQEYAGNNRAAITINIADDDTSPPLIEEIAIAEQAGDGDGTVEPGEAFKVSWSASDPKSIRSTSVSVAGVQRAGIHVGGNRYEAVYPAHTAGEYLLAVSACDDDNSPSCTTVFDVVVVDEVDPPCVADTNGDGVLSPTDFSAWVAAFNSMTASCDQNGDGTCTPTDFSAWIANYNAGCP